MAIGYAIAALICFVLIITIPFGIAALRIGIFALWPFGKVVVRRTVAGAVSAIGNVVWFLLLIPVSLLPFGRGIVSNRPGSSRRTHCRRRRARQSHPGAMISSQS